MNEHGFISQLRRNLVALISLTIAISSLGYNTWRNEHSEDNRNKRFAAFEIIKKLNQFQQLVFHRRYDPELVVDGNARSGWVYVLTIQDMAKVLPNPMAENAEKLRMVWSDNWGDLQANNNATENILTELDNMRDSTIQLLKALN
ncbi:MAG: hypothetical protein WBC60_06645 [Cognaticolwellia sp.]